MVILSSLSLCEPLVYSEVDVPTLLNRTYHLVDHRDVAVSVATRHTRIFYCPNAPIFFLSCARHNGPCAFPPCSQSWNNLKHNSQNVCFVRLPARVCQYATDPSKTNGPCPQCKKCKREGGRRLVEGTYMHEMREMKKISRAQTHTIFFCPRQNSICFTGYFPYPTSPNSFMARST